MRRRDDAAAACESVKHGCICVDAGAGMQKQDRPAVAPLDNLDVGAADRDGRNRPCTRGHTLKPVLFSCPPFPLHERRRCFKIAARKAGSTERNARMSSAEKLLEIETRPGVTYATHDSVALAGDLYLPKGAGPFPALVG